MNDKIGGSKVISIYWFVILMIIAGGIFAMVYSFYHHPYDVREIEGQILINDIADCLSQQGELTGELFDGGKFSNTFKDNFLDICHINFETEDYEEWKQIPQYYLDLKFYNASDLENLVFEISKGNNGLISDCNIQEEKEYQKTAKCIEKDLFSFSGENLYLIKILTVIRKTEKNVK